MRIKNLENLRESIEPVEAYLNSFLDKTNVDSLASRLLTDYFERDRDYLFSLSGTELTEEEIPKYLEALMRMEGLVSIVNKSTVKSFPDRVRGWAQDRSIFTNGTIEGQLIKLDEEVDELKAAIRDRDEEEQRDGIADISIVLVGLSHMLGHNYEDCLEGGWDVISSRTGEMVDGMFVKDDDNKLTESTNE